MNSNDRGKPRRRQSYACVDVAVVKRRAAEERDRRKHGDAEHNELNEVLHTGRVA